MLPWREPAPIPPPHGMEDQFSKFGIAGLVVIMALRLAFDFGREVLAARAKKTENEGGNGHDTSPSPELVYRAIQELAHSFTRQTAILEELLRSNTRLEQKIDSLRN